MFSGSTPPEQVAIRNLFGRLTNPGEATADLRRRVLLADFAGDQSVKDLVERFGSARLLTFDRDPASREPTVEVAHEALLREWPRLVEWLDEDAEFLRSVDAISRAANSWNEGGRRPTDLYRGGRLEKRHRPGIGCSATFTAG